MRRPVRTQSADARHTTSLESGKPGTLSREKSTALSMTLSEPAALPSFYQNRSRASSPAENPQSYLPPWFLLHSASVFRSQHCQENSNNNLYTHFHQSMFNLSYQPSQRYYENQCAAVDDMKIHHSKYREEDFDEISSPEKISINSSQIVPARPNKKLKRVFSMLNFPRKIKKIQAEKNRFNIYTIPVETREQLKQIYVY